jgi:hypothetical protein
LPEKTRGVVVTKAQTDVVVFMGRNRYGRDIDQAEVLLFATGMAILLHSRLSRLLAAIYSAAEDPSKWDDFLGMLATDLAGAAPVIVTVDGASPVCNVVAFSNLDSEAVKQYDQYWNREDIYAKSGHPLTRTEGAAFPSHAVVPQQIARRTRFVNEYQIPNGMGHNITGVVAARPALWAMLSCNFPIRRRMPSEDEIDLVQLLVPHLRRAVYLYQQLQGLTLDETAMSEVVDELPVGLALVGRMAALSDSIGRQRGLSRRATG